MNTLFPVFLKLHELDLLIVGGGNVGLEKIGAVLRNSPEARVTLVAGIIRDEIKELAHAHPTVRLIERNFEWADLEQKDMVILATDQPALHEQIKAETKRRRILTNVADTPHLCDCYLGAVVQKGDLKIGISTNGKSPTLAKRIREYLEEAIPDDVQALLDNLQAFRNRLKGDFQHKIEALNELTKGFAASKEKE